MSTACSEFENLVAGYGALEESERARVDAHLGQCANCSALMQGISDLERALQAEYGGVCAPPSVLNRVGARLSRESLPKPGALPAILDMLGWSAVACAAGIVVWYAAPPVITFTATALYATAGLLTLGGLAVTLWAMRENED